MQTIQPVQLEEVGGPVLRLLEIVKSERAAFFNEKGSLANMMQTMAQSPRAMDAYLKFHRTLAEGSLPARIREQIALAVAQANQCEYSLAQHVSLAQRLGLAHDEIVASREARSTDPKVSAALQFAKALVTHNGEFSTEQLADAGYNDSEIVEIVAQVALNSFENYFNAAVKTDLDFPKVALAAKAA